MSINLCVKCVHYEKAYETSLLGCVIREYCKHQKSVLNVNLIDGNVSALTCEKARAFFGPCGKKGRLYE